MLQIAVYSITMDTFPNTFTTFACFQVRTLSNDWYLLASNIQQNFGEHFSNFQHLQHAFIRYIRSFLAMYSDSKVDHNMIMQTKAIIANCKRSEIIRPNNTGHSLINFYLKQFQKML